MDGWMDQNQEACIFEKLDVRHCHTISKVKLMCMQGSTNDPKKIMIFNEKHDVEWPKQHWFYLFSKNGLPRNQMPKMEISFIKFHWKKIKKNIMYNQNNTGFIRCHSKINRLLCKTKPFQKLQAIVMITNQESIFLAKVLLDLVWSSKSIRRVVFALNSSTKLANDDQSTTSHFLFSHLEEVKRDMSDFKLDDGGIRVFYTLEIAGPENLFF